MAKEYVLFATESDGIAHPVTNYNAIVGSLKSGDVVKFSDGKSFTLNEDLHGGKGSMSRIFSVREPAGLALRLPQQSNPLFLDMINRSIDGYIALHEAGVPVVSIHGSKRGQYLLVDQIKPRFITAETFFRESDRVKPAVRNKMAERLVEFAKTTAYFKHIGDFGLSQIAYDSSEDRWILLDWTAGHETFGQTTASSNCFEHAFDNVINNLTLPQKKWTASVQLEISQAIKAERKRIRSTPYLLDRLKRVEEKTASARAPVPSAKTNFMGCFTSELNHFFSP